MSIRKEIEYAKEYTQIYNDCKEEFIETACEWLWQNIEQCIFEDMTLDEILQEFRKAMK